MYVQVISSDYVKRWNTFKPIQIPDKEEIRPPGDIAGCTGAPGLHDLQLDQLDTEKFQLITNPVHVFRCDFSVCVAKCMSMRMQSCSWLRG